MEIVFALGITCLAGLGLALGLMLRGAPLRTACEGAACLRDSPCPGCPNRPQEDAEGSDHA